MRFIKVNDDSIVTAIRIADEIVDGEIESENGELGQRMLSDGTFEDVTVEVAETISIKDINDNQLIIMDAIATLFELIGG